MIKTYSFYDSSTGLFTGKHLQCDDAAMIATTLPNGMMALEGAYDHLSHRVDLATGQIVRYQPPAPSEGHEWNPATNSWQLNAGVHDGQARRNAVMSRIHALEVSQGRALREATLGDASAVQRLKEIDDAIKALRRELM